MVSQSGVDVGTRRRYDSAEGILKSLESWGKFWTMVQMRREAAVKGESLSWFLVWGQFELREDGRCLQWKPELSGIEDRLLEKESFLRRDGQDIFSSSLDGFVVIPPMVLRCPVCGHIFHRNARERITRIRNFLSLERFVGTSVRRMLARMVNPTSGVYGVPLQVELQNRREISRFNLLEKDFLDRMICDGDYLGVDFLRFFHEKCGLSEEERPEWIRTFPSEIQSRPERVKKVEPVTRQTTATTIPSPANGERKVEDYCQQGQVKKIGPAVSWAVAAKTSPVTVNEGGDLNRRRKRAGRLPKDSTQKKRGRKCQDSGTAKQAKRQSDLRRRESDASVDVKNWYQEKVQTFRLLSAEEERDIAEKVCNGDDAAFNALVHANLRLASWLAFRFWKRHPKRVGMDIQDCIQEANLALLDVVHRFNPEWGVKFSSYAIPYINGCLQGAYAKVSSAISIPKGLHWKFVKFGKSMERFLEVFGREEAMIRAAADAKVPLKIAREFAGMYLAGVVSLDAELSGADEMNLLDILPDRKPSAESRCFAEERRRIVQDSVKSLPRQQRDVLSGRFGIFDDNERTLGSLGQEMDLSRQRINQVESKGKRSLREKLGLRGYSKESLLEGDD